MTNFSDNESRKIMILSHKVITNRKGYCRVFTAVQYKFKQDSS